MNLAVQIVAIIFMITLIVISILVCITAKQAHSQLRYQNYLLEKLTHNINLLVSKDILSNTTSEYEENEVVVNENQNNEKA